MQLNVLPIFFAIGCIIAVAIGLLVLANLINPGRPGGVKRMPYESGMDPIHDTRRRFDVRFYLIAIAFLVFDVELLFLYPWAVTLYQPGHPTWAFAGGMIFLGLLLLGFLYDWKKGIFQWR
jgi:NADH:ubiquinone oxidoreductase subunit 3 (subunit A)